MADSLVEEFLVRVGNYTTWVLVGLLIGFLPYLFATRRRPDLHRQARGVYAGAAVGFGLLVGGAFPLFPSGESDVGPVIDGGRYESPDRGFALTFPEGWTVGEATTPETDGMEPLLEASSATEQSVCVVFDITRAQQANPAWSSLEGGVEGDMLAYRADPATVDVESGFLTLPSGRAAYSGYLNDEGVHFRNYYLARADRWLSVGCGARTLPDDRWLAVLEGFEWR
ncbi:MAG: hypothetical protein PVH07_07565 [Chloroflexota bacterium]|jgi:hypothetical protein